MTAATDKMIAWTRMKKADSIWVVLIVGLLAAAVFVCWPLQKKYASTLAAVTAKKEDIARVKASGINVLSPSELNRVQQEASDFKAGFVDISEVSLILNNISELSGKHAVRVLNINSEAPEPLERNLSTTEVDASTAALRATGFRRLPIRIKLVGRYAELSDFMASLNEMSKKRSVIESFELRKSTNEPGMLECNMLVSFFLKQ